MISAFGVDHGEVSKAFRIRNPMQAFKAAKPTSPTVTGPSGPQKIKNALNRIGTTPMTIQGMGGSAGRGVSALGGMMQRHPGTTGTAMLGGGGAAGYRAWNKRQPQRKR